ncbi:MAG: ROK family transcriptional regulator [Microvirga sp.]
MTTPQAIRQLNERRVLGALFRSKGMSRAELARTFNLTRSTTGYLVQDLINAGLLRERLDDIPENEGKLGRPGILVEIAPDGAFFVGADIGVDRIRAVAIDLSATLRHEASRPFVGRGCTPEDAAAVTAEVVRDVRGRLSEGSAVRGLSVAIPGFLAADERSYHASLLGWHGVDIVRVLGEHLGTELPILVENDANAFAFEETYLQGEDASDALVVHIENGVGGGIISGGRIHRGRLRGAGEIGHMRIGEEGYVFDSQRPGRFESYVGKEALLARYRYYGGRGTGLEDLAAAVSEGEYAARRALDDWARRLAHGLSILVSVLEPQRIILGGSVGSLYDHVAAEVETLISAQLPEGYPMPTVERSKLSEAGPAVGGAYLLHQAMLSMGEQFSVPP